MRTLAAATAALVIASGVTAADGKKKGFTNAWPPKKVQYNPKEIAVDKTVPWQKDGKSTGKKAVEKIRVLGEKDMAVGTIRRIDPELGLVEIQSDSAVAAAYVHFKDVPLRDSAAAGAKSNGKKAAAAERAAKLGRVKFNEFTIKKATDAAPIQGSYAELVKLKGFTIMVNTEPNAPVMFEALARNESAKE
jgi:hypothetical protein